MALGLREFPLFINVLMALAVALLVLGAGIYVPGSPLQSQNQELAQVQNQLTTLNREVGPLKVYDQRRTELQADIVSLQKELDNLKTIVPEEKEVDEFMRMLQAEAGSSSVDIRRLTSKPVNQKEYHYELPFELEFDGGYFAIWNFFAKLGRLSRIVNVSDLDFSGVGPGRGRAGMRPGTTVTGTATATTFFTKGPEGEAGGAAAGKQPAKQPGRP